MPPRNRSIGRFAATAAVAAGLLTTSLPGLAQSTPREPRSFPYTCPDQALGPEMAAAPDRSQSPIVIYAQELDAGRTTVGEARGNVELFRADQHLATDRVLFDPLNEVVTVPGALEYDDQQIWLRGARASYSFVEESGRFEGIDYGLVGSSANGHAEAAELAGSSTSILSGLDYTSCPGETPDWQLRARELELQHDKGVGKARGAQLRFKDVPILYAPYFTFPLDDRRKSGFLYPTLGQNSDSGIEIGAPWYWNIAPNQDAVIEPRYFTHRGFMLAGEYRLLTRRTSGSLDFDYMPDDRVADRSRSHYLLRHSARPWEHWRTSLVVERVGDDNYFQDFGTNLSQTARQFLRSSAELRGVGRFWNFQMLADDFQVLDESVPADREPYRRVPRMLYWMDLPLGRSNMALALESELVHFEREEGVTGTRVDLFPRLSWELQDNWGFFTPTLGFRYTGYALDLQDDQGDDQPSTAVPIASLDTGLVFDRWTAGGDLQTLEPRLFYLYVPYKDQDDQPLFDSGDFTFGFSQLFNTNRFSGSDRQGDANQLALAVTTRRFDGPSGKVLWSLSLGQIVYFDRQRVQLDPSTPVDQDYSPFLAEYNWRPFSKISAVAGLQWDWESSQLDLGTLGVRYRGENGQRALFEYRYRRDRVDQFDLRLSWQVRERWRLLSRVNYSFADSDLLEFQAGIEYESCCWAFRTVLRRYLKNREGDFRNTLYLEFNLKGLASIGTRGQELFPD